jgi:predicted nucleotidyltransferase
MDWNKNKHRFMSSSSHNLDRRRQAESAARECERVLRENFGAQEVYLFGSLAGHAPWHSRSDIDLAVEGLKQGSYLTALSELYRLLPAGMDLDLIEIEKAPPALVACAKQEATMARDLREDPAEALKEEITRERANLKRLVGEANSLAQTLSSEPTVVEIRAAGSIAHDFYTGVERIFERVAVILGPGVPGGENWHTSLLQSMELEIRDARPRVIEHELASRLHRYLRFRHLFRYRYGYELVWEELRPLIERLQETDEALGVQLESFLAALESYSERNNETKHS